jgi:hypothetical protein
MNQSVLELQWKSSNKYLVTSLKLGSTPRLTDHQLHCDFDFWEAPTYLKDGETILYCDMIAESQKSLTRKVTFQWQLKHTSTSIPRPVLGNSPHKMSLNNGGIFLRSDVLCAVHTEAV